MRAASKVDLKDELRGCCLFALRLTQSNSKAAGAMDRRLCLIARNDPFEAYRQGVEPVGEGAGHAALVRQRNLSAGSMTDNAAYWQILQTAKPPGCGTDGFALSPQPMPGNLPWRWASSGCRTGGKDGAWGWVFTFASQTGRPSPTKEA